MDNGEEIPGLNESWTFAGAKAGEWISGVVGMLMVSQLFQLNPARTMPLLLITLFGITMLMATLRRRFPDEERGVRNFLMDKLGFAPPGLPPPAGVQPYWSGAPTRKLQQKTWFIRLRLDEVFEEEQKD